MGPIIYELFPEEFTSPDFVGVQWQVAADALHRVRSNFNPACEVLKSYLSDLQVWRGQGTLSPLHAYLLLDGRHADAQVDFGNVISDALRGEGGGENLHRLVQDPTEDGPFLNACVETLLRAAQPSGNGYHPKPLETAVALLGLYGNGEVIATVGRLCIDLITNEKKRLMAARCGVPTD